MDAKNINYLSATIKLFIGVHILSAIFLSIINLPSTNLKVVIIWLGLNAIVLPSIPFLLISSFSEQTIDNWYSLNKNIPDWFIDLSEILLIEILFFIVCYIIVYLFVNIIIIVEKFIKILKAAFIKN